MEKKSRHSLTQTFKIHNVELQVDIAKTKEFYLTQNKITDDCSCNDCVFYATIFIHENLEIFNILPLMGVDLGKNMASEPTGVWCVRDDNDNFLHCQQVYQAVGQLSANNVSKVEYEKDDNGFKVTATFIQAGADKIDIALQIDKV